MRKRKISKSSKLKCVFCQGKGGQPGAKRLSCIVCGGSGRVTVRQPYNVCKECGGTGKKKGTNLYCLACHGKGFIEESPPAGDLPKGDRYPSLAKSPVSKTRRKIRKRKKGKFSKRKHARKSMRKKRGKRSAKPKTKKRKAAAKKARESFFKGLLGTFKL